MKLPTRAGSTKQLCNVDQLVIVIHVSLLLTIFAGSSGVKHNTRYGQKKGAASQLSNVSLSSPLECARKCREGEPPKTCYYHFTLEMYPILGGACKLCTPDNYNELNSTCQCVLADGFEKIFLSTNRMLPGPSIQVCHGDRVVIDVKNQMEGMGVSIHWHGILQKGTPYYDGVPLLTQCPIHQGNTFRYQWNAGNPGTHFWHSHAGLQKMDGLFGSIVIRETPERDPNSNQYDYDSPEHVMIISDWMHESTQEHFPGLIETPGQQPDSLLINGKGRYTYPDGHTTDTPLQIFTVTRGRKYRFRMINAFCSVCPAHIHIEKHHLNVIATDGDDVEPAMVQNIISTAGERYDFVIDANQRPGDYWIHLRGLGECGERDMQQFGILRYTGKHKRLTSLPPNYNRTLFDGVLLNPLDGVCNRPRKHAVCVNQLKKVGHIDVDLLTGKPDVKMFLPFRFLAMEPKDIFQPNTYEHFMVAPNTVTILSLIDGISFKSPSSPPLSQSADIPPEQYCNGKQRPAHCGLACLCTHKINIPLHAKVEICLVDEIGAANLTHPFHLHGFSFHVLATGRSLDKNVTKINVKYVADLDRKGLIRRMFDKPPLKDTLAVPDNGYVVFRFRADNPGYWLMHCHFLYHTVIGMDLVFHVGKASDLPPVPPGFPVCGDHLPPIMSPGH